MSRLFNFSAGPAMLPEAVLQRAQQEFLDWDGSGMNVMEMSHRGKEFLSIANQAEADLREVMSIPDNYKVLFLQGGASAQFTAIPMNLLRGKTTADYFNTGQWSKKAISEAKRYCDVNIVASSEDDGFNSVPDKSSWKLNPDAAYVHYTANETIGGVEFDEIPDTGDVPLVVDLSSTILSRPIDVSKFALIYAGAQKNIGPAGLTIVIVRDDLIGDTIEGTPTTFDYKVQADNDSMYNTPPTYALYLAGLVFDWVKGLGGLAGMAEINQRKAEKLYAAIDGSDFYQNPVNPQYRSWMNVTFTLNDASLDADFLAGAKQAGLVTLKGHRSVGGMRASIYNAMPEEGIDTLIKFMQEFAQQHR
ncbi:MAG: 3-phosphoserine/phosphohydroxythreonine transaminase [Methylophaga sp.]|nr:3-phosphoserine/phosphohydroxythreonine transaminase [Methylophaga sp.]